MNAIKIFISLRIKDGNLNVLLWEHQDQLVPRENAVIKIIEGIARKDAKPMLTNAPKATNVTNVINVMNATDAPKATNATDATNATNVTKDATKDLVKNSILSVLRQRVMQVPLWKDLYQLHL
jgi:hypothetical protein